MKALNFSKATANKLLVLVLTTLFLSSGLLNTTSEVLASGCESLPVYTDFYQGKPALIVYHPDGHPNSANIHAYYWHWSLYQWEYVPKSNWGVRFDAPQLHSGGWSYYFIASRWIWIDGEHDAWNNDNRWYVHVCS